MRNVFILGAWVALCMACTGPKPAEVLPEEDARSNFGDPLLQHL